MRGMAWPPGRRNGRIIATQNMGSRLALLLAAACLSAVDADASGSICVDAPADYLCLNWTHSGPNISFSARCAPPAGMHTTFWCAFGLSHAATGDMFPSVVTAIQSAGAGAFYLEDRDSFIGYKSPPCFATQLSALLSASLQPDGTLLAAWTRPVNVSARLQAEHYQDFAGPLTLIAASSADTGAAAQRCDPQMQLHTYCVPGVRVDIG